jgi:energy-converting hydrogenase Eha subunit C
MQSPFCLLLLYNYNNKQCFRPLNYAIFVFRGGAALFTLSHVFTNIHSLALLEHISIKAVIITRYFLDIARELGQCYSLYFFVFR